MSHNSTHLFYSSTPADINDGWKKGPLLALLSLIAMVIIACATPLFRRCFKRESPEDVEMQDYGAGHEDVEGDNDRVEDGHDGAEAGHGGVEDGHEASQEHSFLPPYIFGWMVWLMG